MPIRLPDPPRAGCTSGSPLDRHDPHRSDPHHAGLNRTALNRRTALRLAGGTTVGVLAVATVTGCVDDTVYGADPLAAQEVFARADAAAATAAIAVLPQRHAALSAIAAERTAHADALRAEIDRVIGVYGDGTTPVRRTRELAVPGLPAPPTTSSTPVSPTAPIGVDELRAQLTESKRTAAELTLTQSGYRAGLLASISAACAAQAGVLLT